MNEEQRLQEARQHFEELCQWHGTMHPDTIDEMLETLPEDQVELVTDQLTMAIVAYAQYKYSESEIELDKAVLFLNSIESVLEKKLH